MQPEKPRTLDLEKKDLAGKTVVEAGADFYIGQKDDQGQRDGLTV